MPLIRLCASFCRSERISTGRMRIYIQGREGCLGALLCGFLLQEGEPHIRKKAGTTGSGWRLRIMRDGDYI